MFYFISFLFFIFSLFCLVYCYCYYYFLFMLFMYANNNSWKALIWLLRRGKYCWLFARSWMFKLGITLKDKQSRLFHSVSIQEYDSYQEMWFLLPLICTGKALFGSGYMWLRKRKQFSPLIFNCQNSFILLIICLLNMA